MIQTRLLAFALILSCASIACTTDQTESPDAGHGETTDTGRTDADTTDGGDTADGGDADAGDNDIEQPPDFESHFNRPEPGDEDRALEDLVVELLGDVPADATVRAAYYTFSRTRVAEAFGDARDRGVDIELIVDNDSRHDDGSDWQAVEILRDRLGDAFFICRDDRDSGGCHGTGINHNKFIAFSELGDGSEDVVLQSSANLTNPQLHDFNNTVVIRGDTALYETYLDYWRDLRADETDLDYDRTAEGDLATHVRMFPREEGDPVIDILEDVDCSTGTRLHLGMSHFTDPRADIAAELSDLADAGCEVRAVVREGLERGGFFVLSTLGESDVDVSVFDSEDDVTIHSKYLLLDGDWRDRTNQNIVWTGSHNYTGPALRDNDEILLRIRDEQLYEDYLTNWEHVEEYAEPLNP